MHSSGQLNNNKKQSLVSYVDPYIGSSAHGHVFVGASVPFGAVQVGPNNINKGWDWCSGYHYSDSVVKGFSQNHLSGTGIPDLGDILIMPYTGDIRTIPGSQQDPLSGYSGYYNHADEIVSPAYYSLIKSDSVRVELTASERVAFHKYSFPSDKNGRIIIDLEQGNVRKSMNQDKVRGYIWQKDEFTLLGWRNSNGWAKDRRMYFAIKTNFPVKDLVIYLGNEKYPGKSLEAKSVKAVISFLSTQSPVLLKIGVSPVSSENALNNIGIEIPAWDFTKVVEEASLKWEKALSLVNIKTGNDTLKKIFYTALYHSMIAPALYNDVDSSYRGADKNIYTNPGFDNYTIFSLWDTYRAHAPLMTIVQPKRMSDFVNSMLAIYSQQGKLPIWHLQGNETDCMVGYSAVPVIADAYIKGIRGFDTLLAFKAMKESSIRDDFGMKYIKEMGFIPADKEVESVSKALEYAIGDWSVAQIAKRQSREKEYEYYLSRSKYYNKYFDSSLYFVRGRMSDGKFRKLFNPVTFDYKAYDFTEGTSWQYTWLVPHDVEGLISLFKNETAFVNKLDSLFILKEHLGEDAPLDISGLIGLYAHGNEPNHHIPYLYAFAGYQWKTAEKARQILTGMYTSAPDGLCGNEDCGQMSAWYILSALGFYQVNPSNGMFVFGSPLFDEAVIETGNGKTFTIEARNNSLVNKYINRVWLNGKKYHKAYINYSDIMQGGKLTFSMSAVPNKKFGKLRVNRPFSKIE